MTVADFADPAVEEIVTHRFEVVTVRCDGSVHHHAFSAFDPPEADR